MEPEVETKVLPEPAVESRSNAAPEISSRRSVGRYELIHRLGYGGMATVFLARARGLGGFEKLVAVKVIHQHLAAEPEFVGMFLDEARIAARLRSPHVGEVLDVGEDSGLYYMVMEYIEGETLSSLLRAVRDKNVKLPGDVILQIMTDACAGLSAVHELCDPDGNPYDLVHRDVSPQNLLITMSGWVKLVDFGIAKATGVNRSTLTGHLRGKLPYMAPEQARGKALSRASDVFALGVILWELCAERRLFAASSDAETLSSVMRCEIPPLPEERARELPAGVRALLERALAVDPTKRFATAAAMLEELRAQLWAERARRPSDPRHALSETMRELFGEQAAYRRATARGRGQPAVARPVSLVALTPTPGVGIDAGASTQQQRVVRTLSLVTGGAGAREVTPARADGSSPSLSAPGLVGSAEDPHTLTTSSLESPAPRHWSLWLLLLPFVGAGIAVMAINFTGARRLERSVTPTVTNTPMSVDDPSAPASQTSVPPAREPVTWLISSEPAGATVTITGLPEDARRGVLEQLSGQTTPVLLELPFHREPVTVKVTLDGYRSRSAVRMPVSDENLALRLERSADASTELGARKLARTTRIRMKQPTRDSKQTKKPNAGAGGHEGERPRPTDTSGGGDTKTSAELPLEPSFKPLRPRDEPGG
ncbi:MAG: serine/threonine protein kinase [Myxococcales bacterium]|nr:serine/threonine protein kinase [Myxococcales bacterium]